MSQQVNTGKSTLTGTVNAGFGLPTSTQTIANYKMQATGSNQAVHTAAAGTKVHLMGAGYYAVAAGSLEIFKNDGTTKVLDIPSLTTAPNGFNVAPFPLWTYEAGEVCYAKATNTHHYNVFLIVETI